MNACYTSTGAWRARGPQSQRPNRTVSNAALEFDGCFDGYGEGTSLTWAAQPTGTSACPPDAAAVAVSPSDTASPTPTETAPPTLTSSLVPGYAAYRAAGSTAPPGPCCGPASTPTPTP